MVTKFHKNRPVTFGVINVWFASRPAGRVGREILLFVGRRNINYNFTSLNCYHGYKNYLTIRNYLLLSSGTRISGVHNGVPRYSSFGPPCPYTNRPIDMKF